MAIDFSFPAWLRDQHSFADSLAKGAQVGAIIANNRYRNQALAAQAIQAEREYELRDRQLAAQVRTDDLNFQIRSQLIADTEADRVTTTDWIQKRNELPLEERIAMPLPTNVRLPQTYGIMNQVVDNDRMTYERSVYGQADAAIAQRLRHIPADYILRYKAEPDWDSKMQILAEGEEKARTSLLNLYQPREMTTAEGERLVYNPKTGSFKFGPQAIGDEVVTRPITDETGNVIGHAMRSGDKWVRIPESKGEQTLREIRYRKLADELAEVRGKKVIFGGNPQSAARIAEQEAAILKEMQDIESKADKPSPPSDKDPLGLFK